MEHGVREVVERSEPVVLQTPGTSTNDDRVHLWLSEVSIGKPVRDSETSTDRRDPRVFPRECREAGATYKAPMFVTVCWKRGEDGSTVFQRRFKLCMFPVMVCSVACHLSFASRADLVLHGEESMEMGGYFILNGNERIIRLLIQQRRHYIMGLRRSAYSSRGPVFTEYATAIRCVAPDEHSGTIRVHYCTNGSAQFALVFRRQVRVCKLQVITNKIVKNHQYYIFCCPRLSKCQ